VLLGLRLPEEGTVKAPVGGVLGALKEASKCPKLTEFVTASPLPESGVGWDYKVQLQATGGAAPVKFLTPYFDRATGVQTALSCSSGGSSPSGPAYYPGQMMVEGLTLNCDGRITGQPKAPVLHSHDCRDRQLRARPEDREELRAAVKGRADPGHRYLARR
jgi:hypothetical protein